MFDRTSCKSMLICSMCVWCDVGRQCLIEKWILLQTERTNWVTLLSHCFSSDATVAQIVRICESRGFKSFHSHILIGWHVKHDRVKMNYYQMYILYSFILNDSVGRAASLSLRVSESVPGEKNPFADTSLKGNSLRSMQTWMMRCRFHWSDQHRYWLSKWCEQ